MGLFKKKIKITAEDWCNAFYNESLFAEIENHELWATFGASTKKSLAEEDASLLSVDTKLFADQLLALRLEVIGIAWLLRFGDNQAPRQSEQTRLYLQRKNRNNLWDMMEPYNQATAESTLAEYDSETRTGRAGVAAVNSMRANLFDKWIKEISDPKDAARPANRTGCQNSWKSGRTPIYLSFALTRQLDCEIEDEARDKLMYVILGFFEGATAEMLGYKIVS